MNLDRKTFLRRLSAGVVGLVQAIDRFTPVQGVKFESYAVPRIRGAILDSLRSLDWVPRSVRARSRQIQGAITDLQNELGRSATDAEIAQRLGISADELHDWLTSQECFCPLHINRYECVIPN